LWPKLSVLENKDQIVIESIDKGIWDAIVNGPYTPKCVVENK